MESIRPEHRLKALLARASDADELISYSVRGVEVPVSNGGGAVPRDVYCVGRGVVKSVRVYAGFGVGGCRLPFEGEGAVVHNCTWLGDISKRGEEDRLVSAVVVRCMFRESGNTAPAVDYVAVVQVLGVTL